MISCRYLYVGVERQRFIVGADLVAKGRADQFMLAMSVKPKAK